MQLKTILSLRLGSSKLNFMNLSVYSCSYLKKMVEKCSSIIIIVNDIVRFMYSFDMIILIY